METLLQVQEICKYYRMGEVQITAVDHVSFSVEKGEFVVIVGASGAGKTTVLNLLGGMDTCDSGSILVDGTDITKLRKRKLAAYRRFDIGFVFQFYNLIPNLTAVENVELAGHISRDAMPAAEALQYVGLGDRLRHFPAQLSGGEQQRVSIARALAKRPKLLLCDEPTGALDYETGKSVLKLLQDTCRDTQMTVLLITHNQAITPMADRVITMKNGKIAAMQQNAEPFRYLRLRGDDHGWIIRKRIVPYRAAYVRTIHSDCSDCCLGLRIFCRYSGNDPRYERDGRPALSGNQPHGFADSFYHWTG